VDAVGAGRGLVVLLETVEEPLVGVGPAIHQRALRVLHHRDDVLAAERLVRLQRVRQAQHLDPVVVQQAVHPPQQGPQRVLDPVGQRPP